MAVVLAEISVTLGLLTCIGQDGEERAAIDYVGVACLQNLFDDDLLGPIRTHKDLLGPIRTY
jgi:hypothetical protein